MAKAKGSGENEVLFGGKKPANGKQRQPGITGIDNWERDFESEYYGNELDKMLELPGIDDMAGVLARGNFKNERQRIAAVRLAYRHRKFHDQNHQKMLRDYVASGMGMSALGKILQLQIGTNLIAPGVLREILGMKKVKKGEDVQRGSDFRQQRDDRQDNGGQP